MKNPRISSFIFIFFFLIVALSMNFSISLKINKLNSKQGNNTKNESRALEAIAFLNAENITGRVYFEEKEGDEFTHVYIRVSGLEPNSTHGIHIHEYGDFSNGCDSFGGHYNPYNETHGEPGKGMRHEGDMGNLRCNEKGICEKEYLDHVIQLAGRFSVIGRGVVLHAKFDDLHSNPAGDSGERIVCGVIGLKAPITQKQ